MSELKTQTIQGLQWSGISQVSRQAWQLVTSAILARLLSPADYGLLGMAVVFAGFAGIFLNLGFSISLVQRPQLDERHINSVFALNLAMGLLLAGIMMGAAPIIARFYHEPRLTLMVCVLALNFIITGFQSVPSLLLTREMRFRSLAIRDMLAQFISGIVALTLAFLGCGVWSLVVQMLTASLLGTVLVWLLLPQRPRPIFNGAALREMWKVSGNYLGSNVINYWSRNADSLLIGKYLGKIEVGIYSRAYSLMLLPLSQITSIVSQVMFPALSRIQDDHEKVRRVYLKALRMIAFITFPMMTGLFVVAEPFILVLCGPKWLAAVPVLKIFCLVGLAQSVGTTAGWIFTSQGRTDLMLWWTAATMVLFLMAFITGLHWGVVGVASCYGIMYALIWYPMWRLVGGIIGLHFKEIMGNLASIFFVSVIMAGCVFAIDLPLAQLPAWIRLLGLSVIGVLIYLGFIITSRNATLADWLDLLARSSLNRWLPARLLAFAK